MKRQLLSLPIISDELSIYSDKEKIAEILDISSTQEKFFFHKNSFYRFQAFHLPSRCKCDETIKDYHIWHHGVADGFKIEDENYEK